MDFGSNCISFMYKVIFTQALQTYNKGIHTIYLGSEQILLSNEDPG